jgi:ribosome biogenesis protein ERB1
MVVELSDPETDEDEIHSTNTLGRIPLHWYDDEGHLGYDLDGKKVQAGLSFWVWGWSV